MAVGPQTEFQDKLSDITECSICAAVFTNPKILPCVHTFCLHCLENYGKEKKPGNQMACPLCRNQFVIPDEGFHNLPNNFFIGKLVEIGKLVASSVNESLCELCPEGEELVAKMHCIDCEQILCERCRKSHKKTKFSQNHQVVELGSKLNAREFTTRNSYCEHHPKELIKIYCHEDNVPICVLCHIESHQSHRCVNVERAAEEFKEQLKDDLRKVDSRLPECEEALKILNECKNEFKEEILKTEESIRDAVTNLKELVDQHAETLIQKLKSVTEKNTKAFDITKHDIERFGIMIDSYNRFSQELLTKGSPVDICRAACQMHFRANQLDKLEVNLSGDDFYCDTVALSPSNVEDLLRNHGSNNAIGLLTVTPSSDRSLVFQRDISVSFPCETEAIKFVMKRQELKSKTEDALQRNKCTIKWPETESSDVNLLIDNGFHQNSLKDRKSESQMIVQNLSSDVNCMNFKVDPEAWNDFKSAVQDPFIQKSIERLLDIVHDNDLFEIQYTGIKKNIDRLQRILGKLKTSLKKELDRRKSRISETMTNLMPHQLFLIGTEQFQMKLEQEFPKVGFEIKTTEITLCGTTADVNKAGQFLCEKVESAVNDSFKISKLMSKVFAKDEAKPYLMQQLLGKGISATWMCNDREVAVVALDDKNLKDAIEILKNEVVEVRLCLNRFDENFCQSRRLKSFIRRLCKEYKFLEFSVNPEILVVACMRSSIEKIKRRIGNFIASIDMHYVCLRFPMCDPWQ